jgi:hypothetical protein
VYGEEHRVRLGQQHFAGDEPYGTSVQVPERLEVKPSSVAAMSTIADPSTLSFAMMSSKPPLKPDRRAQ